jgi:hypothetical protein
MLLGVSSDLARGIETMATRLCMQAIEDILKNPSLGDL